ncbi:MAG: hypothetical protein HYV07_20120 [Deltaproteobacteria bacterium]|nr:hypothetical protein [Deltaproteobacteria bacterium]
MPPNCGERSEPRGHSKPGFPLLLLLGPALVGCSVPAATTSARCSTDADCASGACVADLTLDVSYCTTGCVTDDDCPAHQSCRVGVDRFGSSADTVSLCVDRIRKCAEDELCNGLDDDCDGVIDGPACAPITRCLEDAPCGAFVCQAPDNQPDTLCAPATSAPVDSFEVCGAGSDCRNGDCSTGICSPFCRPDRAEVCEPGFACAQAVGNDSAPAHNLCQPRCQTAADCAASFSCVWRPVYQGFDEHVFVCARPASGRLPLGAVCPDNTPSGDDACESGLCYERRCTRPCGAAGADCSDVSGTSCLRQQLYYGQREFQVFVCSTENR